jgi:FkbM family methyltransferase
MTKTRLKVLKHYLNRSKHHTNVRFGELMRYLTDSSYQAKAARMIESRTPAGDFNEVRFKGHAGSLSYPRKFPMSSLDQVVVESLYDTNWHYYEIPQTRVLPDDVVVDCGAAEGMFGFLVADRCKKAYMIEPLPTFCEAMQKTFASKTNVEVVPVALSDTEGTARMNEDSIASSLNDSVVGIEVKVTTLDRLFFDTGVRVDYIKMDLEGFDCRALRGAEQLIRRDKPRIAVTTYHAYDDASDIETFLKRVVPEYQILTKGIYQNSGCPVMLHAWT